MHAPDEFSQSVVTGVLILKSLVPYAESRRQAKLLVSTISHLH